MDKNLRPYLFELVGTFAVVFLAAATVCASQVAGIYGAPPPGQSGMAQPGPGLIGIALAYGLIYAAALALTVPQGGGFLNPALTLMLWVFKRIDGGKTIGL